MPKLDAILFTYLEEKLSRNEPGVLFQQNVVSIPIENSELTNPNCTSYKQIEQGTFFLLVFETPRLLAPS